MSASPNSSPAACGTTSTTRSGASWPTRRRSAERAATEQNGPIRRRAGDANVVRRGGGRQSDVFVTAPHLLGSGLAAPDEPRGLRPRLVAGPLHDRRHLGIRDEALPPVLVPVEDHPHPVLLGGIAEDGRALGAMLPALLGALG